MADAANDFEQALLRYLRPEQLAAVRRFKVGIAGAGGLGSNCAAALVRCGFRRLKIADFDVVEASNLNRQFFFRHQIGCAKLAALADNLAAINPAVELELLPGKADAGNVAALFADCDAVVEAFDRPEYKKLVVEAYLGTGKLLVAASGLAGWGDSDRIAVRRVRDDFYLVGDLATGIGPDRPPLAPCVAIAAAKQADIVLAHVLGPMKGVDNNESSSRNG